MNACAIEHKKCLGAIISQGIFFFWQMTEIIGIFLATTTRSVRLPARQFRPVYIPHEHGIYTRPIMKVLLNIVKWSAIIAGVISIPLLIQKRAEELERRAHDVRYDTNDYISDTTL